MANCCFWQHTNKSLLFASHLHTFTFFRNFWASVRMNENLFKNLSKRLQLSSGGLKSPLSTIRNQLKMWKPTLRRVLAFQGLCLQSHHPQDACVSDLEKDQEGQESHQEEAVGAPQPQCCQAEEGRSKVRVKKKKIISNIFSLPVYTVRLVRTFYVHCP